MTRPASEPFLSDRRRELIAKDSLVCGGIAALSLVGTAFPATSAIGAYTFATSAASCLPNIMSLFAPIDVAEAVHDATSLMSLGGKVGATLNWVLTWDIDGFVEGAQIGSYMETLFAVGSATSLFEYAVLSLPAISETAFFFGDSFDPSYLRDQELDSTRWFENSEPFFGDDPRDVWDTLPFDGPADHERSIAIVV